MSLSFYNMRNCKMYWMLIKQYITVSLYIAGIKGCHEFLCIYYLFGSSHKEPSKSHCRICFSFKITFLPLFSQVLISGSHHIVWSLWAYVLTWEDSWLQGVVMGMGSHLLLWQELTCGLGREFILPCGSYTFRVCYKFIPDCVTECYCIAQG